MVINHRTYNNRLLYVQQKKKCCLPAILPPPLSFDSSRMWYHRIIQQGWDSFSPDESVSTNPANNDLDNHLDHHHHLDNVFAAMIRREIRKERCNTDPRRQIRSRAEIMFATPSAAPP